MGVAKPSLRRVAGFVAIVVLATMGLVAAGVGVAGAQAQTTPDTPCAFTVTPVTLPTGGGNVTVAGTAPGDAEVRIFANGIFQVSTHTDNITGQFSVTFFLSQTSEIAVSIDDYPATGCGVGPGQTTAGQGRGRGTLPRTGSDHVESTVLVALALVLVGAVLVVAVRRHEGVRGRRP
jgi:LPXTG-motif cell wall-anchored protein